MDSFDPIKPADQGFERQLYIHRKGFYNLFKKLSQNEYEFSNFMDATVVQMKQSYSIIEVLIHVYVTIWSFQKVIYCSEFEFPCKYRPWTLADSSQWIQFMYYFLCWIPIPKLQQYTYYYGSLMMNGTLFLTYFLTKEYQGILSGGINGSFSALIVPAIYYVIFLFTCARVRLSSWIIISQRQRPIQSRLQLVHQYLWKPFYFLIHMSNLILYNLFTNHYDLSNDKHPNWILLFILNLIICSISYTWINFLTFQIQFVVWEEYWHRGVVLMKFGPEVTIGVLY
jgi:hypothetical protein